MAGVVGFRNLPAFSAILVCYVGATSNRDVADSLSAYYRGRKPLPQKIVGLPLKACIQEFGFHCG